jgi:hypothetical protein
VSGVVDRAGVRLVAGRAAAVVGVAGSAGHLAMAGEHASHSPAITAGMLLLALVCARCSLHLWRRPHDPIAWRDLVVLAVVMTGTHLLAGATGPLATAFLAVPAVQGGLGLVALLARDRQSPRLVTPRP